MIDYVIIAVVGIFFALALVGLIVLWYFEDGSGTYVHEDGKVIEWDGKGGGTILYPNGNVKQYKDGKVVNTFFVNPPERKYE